MWAIDGKKFLFVFTESNDEGKQKVTVWGLKSPGNYQRIKTVWVEDPDYIFEAVALFLSEYFELKLTPDSFFVDVDWYYAIEDELTSLARSCPAYLKQKQKLLKIWSEIMPRYNHMVADLDFKILRTTEPAMKDVKRPHECSDSEEMLRNMVKLNPEIINDFIKAMANQESSLDMKDDEALKEVPDFIDKVVRKWEQSKIGVNSPMDLLAAYCRFDRAWNSYCAAVEGNMIGNICSEYFKRTDSLGSVIDRKINASKSLEEKIMLMNLFRLLMPQYIDHCDEKRNVEYEKWWNKYLAERIAEVGILSPDRAELLIRAREDFKRLPAPLSKFIKVNLPKYLNEEIGKINKDSIKDINFLKSAIKNLDNFIQWKVNVEESTENIGKITDPLIQLIVEEMEYVTDIQALALFGNLLFTGFDPSGTVKDRKDLVKRVEDRLENLSKSGKSGSSKKKNETFIEELLLASIYLENIFLEYKGCDIYTSYWTLYHNDLEFEKRPPSFDPFLLY